MKIDPENVHASAFFYSMHEERYSGPLGDIYQKWLNTPRINLSQWEVYVKNELLSMPKLELALRGIELETKRHSR